MTPANPIIQYKIGVVIVKGLLQKTDEELTQMLTEIAHEPIEWTPVILAELTRRNILRLREETVRLRASSRRLETLTIVLIVLTLVLAILAIPPALESVRPRHMAGPESSSKQSGKISSVPSVPRTDSRDLQGLSNEDLFFLGASAHRRRFTLAEVPEFSKARPQLDRRFEVAGERYIVSRILKDGSIAADEDIEP
jgi:hypothetical protein